MLEASFERPESIGLDNPYKLMLPSVDEPKFKDGASGIFKLGGI